MKPVIASEKRAWQAQEKKSNDTRIEKNEKTK